MRVTRVAALIGFLVIALALGSYPAAANGIAVIPGAADVVVPLDDSIAFGAFQASTGVLNFTSSLGAGDFSGSVQSSVFKEAGGTLDFLYQITVAAGSAASIEHVSISSFGAFTTNAGYVDYLSGTVAPTTANRTSDGSTLNEEFVPGALTAGAESYLFWVQTNSTVFTTGNLSLINRGVATVATFAPETPIPIPPTALLLGSGLLGLLGLRRFRKS